MALYGTVSPGNPMGFKNRIINGDFRIWQRGTSFSSMTSGQYAADRWQLSYRTAGVTIAQQNNTTYYAARLTNTDGSAQTFDFEQRIEDTSQFSNTTYILSFYAKASTTATLGPQVYANYGTGGSTQDTVATTSVTVTTTRTKFTMVLPFPDMSSKTIAAVGSGGSYTRLLLSPSSLPASAWIEIDSVQIEPGSVDTSFDYRPYPTELVMCQRYFIKTFAAAQAPVQNSGTVSGAHIGNCLGGGFGTMCTVRFPVVMRAAPTITGYNPSASNGLIRNTSGSSDIQYCGIATQSEGGFNFYPYGANHDSATGYQWAWHWTAVAEL
jgi:hypothetical protein